LFELTPTLSINTEVDLFLSQQGSEPKIAVSQGLLPDYSRTSAAVP